MGVCLTRIPQAEQEQGEGRVNALTHIPPMMTAARPR